MSENKVVFFSDYERFDWEPNELRKMIYDGSFQKVAFTWAELDSKLNGGEIHHIEKFKAEFLVERFYEYHALFYDEETKKMLGMVWDIAINIRMYYTVGNPEEVMEQYSHTAKKMLRNGCYLYILANHPQMAEALGWEKPTFTFKWSDDWTIRNLDKKSKFHKDHPKKSDNDEN